MNIQERSDETLLRQFEALRTSIRYRNSETGRRSHLHCDWCRKPAAAYVRQFRNELQARGVYPRNRGQE